MFVSDHGIRLVNLQCKYNSASDDVRMQQPCLAAATELQLQIRILRE